MRVVLDTNILVSALMSPDNACRKVINMGFDGIFEPLIGNALFCEYESVLGRDELFERCPFDDEKRDMFLDSVLSICKFIDVRYLWRPNLRDEGDNHIMELAVAGQAGYIITQNIKDFKKADLVMPQVEIIHPFALLEDEEKKRWQH